MKGSGYIADRVWNDAQKKAIFHKDGPCLVLAGPGSGKTAVIVNRVKALIDSGVVPDSILILTFTRAAAAEMETRFIKLCPEESYRGSFFGTFHSFCFDVLREELGYDRDGLLNDREKQDIAETSIVESAAILKNADNLNERLVKSKANKLIKELSLRKSGMDSDGTRDKEVVLYDNELRKRGKFDFDDMVNDCLILFKKDNHALARWQKQYKYLLIDEVQDMNAAQLEVADLLAQKHMNIFEVGDDDQSIYGFRGVKPENMKNFFKTYHEASLIKLNINYRSVPQIVSISGKLIKNNKDRFSKNLKSARSNNGNAINNGNAVKYAVFNDEKDEAKHIASQIIKLHSEGEEYKEIAVLCRVDSQFTHFKRCFNNLNIPFFSTGGGSDAVHPVIRDMNAYYSLATDMRLSGLWRRKDLKVIINVPDRGLKLSGVMDEWLEPYSWSRHFINEKNKFIQANRLIEDIKALGNMDVFSFADYVWFAMGYRNCVAKSTEAAQILSEWKDAKERELKNLTVEKSVLNSGKTILNSRISDIQENELESDVPMDETDKDAVRLITIHASKGLEFKNVFIPTMDDGTIPHIRKSDRSDLYSNVIQEERRVMYVAATRAKDRLFLSSTRMFYGHTPAFSPFLKEMLGQNFMDDYM